MSIMSETSYPNDKYTLRIILDEISTKLNSLDRDLQLASKTQSESDARRQPLRQLFSDLVFYKQNLESLSPEAIPQFISINLGRPIMELRQKVDKMYGLGISALTYKNESYVNYLAIIATIIAGLVIYKIIKNKVK